MDIKDLQALPALTYDQREGAKHYAEILKEKTAYMVALKGVDPSVLKAEMKAKRRAEPPHLPSWVTLWMIYLTAWIFALMVFRANVYPGAR